MQQLAVMRMMRPFCHTLPGARHTSSYQPRPPITSGSAVHGEVAWPGGTEVSGTNKFNTGFPSSGMSLSSAQTEAKLTA